jgi:transposase InsO family protein
MPIATSLVQVLRRPLERKQYAAQVYRDLLATNGLVGSMGRPGNPYDNAKAESFMRTLKGEEVDGRAYRDAADAGQSWAPSSRRSTISSACTRPSRTLAPAEFEATLRAGAIALPVAVAVPS